jgi:hypothetical protein
MIYLNKMNLKYLHHLINLENIKIKLQDETNKKILIKVLIKYYSSKKPIKILTFD